MDNLWQRVGWSGLTVLLLAAAGCSGGGSGGGTTSVAAKDYTSLNKMAGVYAMYAREHKGQLPPDEAAFRAFLATKQDSLDRAGLTVDQMFVSPHGGGALHWVYGTNPPRRQSGGTYIAYEETPVDGKRLVVAQRGMHELIDDSQFQSLFPGSR